MLNTASLDDKVVIKGGSTSGGGNTGGGTAPSRPKWTGHADVEGLKAIGWTDEDIAYYQENGVNWNAEDDQYHLVTDDNKALYGVLTAKNISSYKERIVYLPKIDTSALTSMEYMFNQCYRLVAIPLLDTRNVTSMNYAFQYCRALTSIPPLDTSKVITMKYMFNECKALVYIPILDMSSARELDYMCYNCYALPFFPPLDVSKVYSIYNMCANCCSLVSAPPLDTRDVGYIYGAYAYCWGLISIPLLDANSCSNPNGLDNLMSLIHINLKNIKQSCSFKESSLLSKESLLYLINNEAATSAITITLHSYAYKRLANDADVVAALANHPNISISK